MRGMGKGRRGRGKGKGKGEKGMRKDERKKGRE